MVLRTVIAAFRKSAPPSLSRILNAFSTVRRFPAVLNAPSMSIIARSAKTPVNLSKFSIKELVITPSESTAAIKNSTPPGFSKRSKTLFVNFGSVRRSCCIATNAFSISVIARSAKTPVNLSKFSINETDISVSLLITFIAKSRQPASRKDAILSDAKRSTIVSKAFSICVIISSANSLFASKFSISAIVCFARLSTMAINSS